MGVCYSYSGCGDGPMLEKDENIAVRSKQIDYELWLQNKREENVIKMLLLGQWVVSG